jgi:hypothetical protein
VLQLELLEQRSERLAVARIQASRLLPQVWNQHVEVARGAELAAEPGELAADLVHPRTVEDRRCGLQDRAQPPCGDAELVQILRVAADPHAWVVGQHLRVLVAEIPPQLLELGRRQRELGLRLAGESLLERPGAVRPLGSGLQQGRLEPAQLLPVGGELLELDLAERARRALPVEQRDRGDADLGERPASLLDAHPGRVRPHAQHRRQLEAGRGRRDELSELFRRTCGAAGRLDVQRRDPVTDDAQSPDALAVLDPPPQDEAGEPEASTCSVVEGLLEVAPPKGSAVKRRQLERFSSLELKGFARHGLIVERPRPEVFHMCGKDPESILTPQRRDLHQPVTGDGSRFRLAGFSSTL